MDAAVVDGGAPLRAYGLGAAPTAEGGTYPGYAAADGDAVYEGAVPALRAYGLEEGTTEDGLGEEVAYGLEGGTAEDGLGEETEEEAYGLEGGPTEDGLGEEVAYGLEGGTAEDGLGEETEEEAYGFVAADDSA